MVKVSFEVGKPEKKPPGLKAQGLAKPLPSTTLWPELTEKAISSPTSAVMVLGLKIKPAAPTSTVIVFAAAKLARPKAPRRDRFNIIMAGNEFALGLGEGKLTLTTD
jgi:hypothetical protein